MVPRLVVYGAGHEDGSAAVLARITALDASGVTIHDREGPCLTQDDVVSIACHIYKLAHRDASTGEEVLPAPRTDVGQNILDALQTLGWPTGEDAHGYNFKHTIAPGFFGTASTWHLIEYRLTLVNGAVAWVRTKVKTNSTFSE